MKGTGYQGDARCSFFAFPPITAMQKEDPSLLGASLLRRSTHLNRSLARVRPMPDRARESSSHEPGMYHARSTETDGEAAYHAVKGTAYEKENLMPSTTTAYPAIGKAVARAMGSHR